MADETQTGRDDYVTSESGMIPVPWRTDNAANPVQLFSKIITVDADSAEVTEEWLFARRPRLVLARTGTPDKRDLCADIHPCRITSVSGSGSSATYGVKLVRGDRTIFTDAVEVTGVYAGNGQEYAVDDIVLVMTDGGTEDGAAEIYFIAGDLLNIKSPFRAYVVRVNTMIDDYDLQPCDEDGIAASGVGEASGYRLTSMMEGRANLINNMMEIAQWTKDGFDTCDTNFVAIAAAVNGLHGSGTYTATLINAGFTACGTSINDLYPQVNDFVLAYNNPYGGKYIFDHETLLIGITT